MIGHKTRFLNFTPTDGFQLYANALVGHLMDLAPSDAALFSSIEREGNRYSCRIEIVSAVRRFEAFIDGLNPRSALEEARRRVMRQIAEWRRQRFVVIT